MTPNKMIVSFVFMCVVVMTEASGWSQGVTTRYWDCCKTSCGWWGKAPVKEPVISCDARDNYVAYATKSGCENGRAFTCSNQSPYNVSRTLSYGFVAVKLKNRTERDWCCKCYRLKFDTPLLKNKEMIVQATNTGWDLGDNHFDIAMPGSGQGIFHGCSQQYINYQGGSLFGGVSNVSACYALPNRLVRGCVWRFNWFMNADNPKVFFKEEVCPQELTSITKCRRTKP